MNLLAQRRATLATVIQSQSSSEAETPKNQNRIKTLKHLKTKKNSVLELIRDSRPTQETKAQSSTLFQSERWNFKPSTQTNMRNSLTSSCKLAEENPFLRAKLELLNKQKNSYTYSNSGKSVEEETEDVFQDEEITTFRLLKKGSVNTELEGATYRNI